MAALCAVAYFLQTKPSPRGASKTRLFEDYILPISVRDPKMPVLRPRRKKRQEKSEHCFDESKGSVRGCELEDGTCCLNYIAPRDSHPAISRDHHDSPLSWLNFFPSATVLNWYLSGRLRAFRRRFKIYKFTHLFRLNLYPLLPHMPFFHAPHDPLRRTRTQIDGPTVSLRHDPIPCFRHSQAP